MADEVFNLNDFIDPDEFKPTHQKPENLLNRRLALMGWSLESGNWGPYVLLTVIDPTTNEESTVTTGSQPVMALYAAIHKSIKFPVLFRFEQVGRSVMLQSV